MIKSGFVFSRGRVALTTLGIFLITWLGRADAASVTVTVTQRAPLEAVSSSGDVTGVSEATVGTHYTLVSTDGQHVDLQDAQGAKYRIAVSATDYTPTPPAASVISPPATNSVTQASPTPAITNSTLTPEPVTGNEPVMSGSRTIQFSGASPPVLKRSRFIRYDFDLNQEHFWLNVPSAYDGHEPWGLVVYISPEAKTEELPEGWDQVLNDDKLLFICPQDAGNDQPNSRREGLGVVAAQEMMKFYSIDPNRVYASGFSGGARQAGRLAFHQSDIFRATIQCCGSDFYKPVPRASVTDADRQAHPGDYGLVDADAMEVENAKKQVKFVLITGTEDFRQHYIEDIYNGGFKAEDFSATLISVSGMGHQPCPAHELRDALNFIENSP